MLSRFGAMYVYDSNSGGWKPLEFSFTPNGSDSVISTWSRITGRAAPFVDGSRIEVSAAYANATLTLDPDVNILDPRGLITIATHYAVNAAGTALVPGRMVDETAASLAPVANGSSRGSTLTYVFDGANFVRALGGSVASLATLSPAGSQLVSRAGEWSLPHTPAANVQASVTRAAPAAGQRHVCRSITATLIGLAAGVETTVLVNLRAGITGVGTILWSVRLLVVGGSGSQVGIALSDLNILGETATAMTLEFATAAGANTFEAVTLTGNTTS